MCHHQKLLSLNMGNKHGFLSLETNIAFNKVRHILKSLKTMDFVIFKIKHV